MTQQDAINTVDSLLQQAFDLFKQSDELLKPYESDGDVYQLKVAIPYGSLRVALRMAKSKNGH